MKTRKIKIITGVDVLPEVDIIQAIEAAHGSVYVLADDDDYTITRTDEQKDAYISSLEDKLSESRRKLSAIDQVLYPEELYDEE